MEINYWFQKANLDIKEAEAYVRINPDAKNKKSLKEAIQRLEEITQLSLKIQDWDEDRYPEVRKELIAIGIMTHY